MSSKQDGLPFWPKFNIKDKIRSPKTQRILEFILILGLHLKGKVGFGGNSHRYLKSKIALPILVVTTVLAMHSGGQQANLQKFRHEQSNDTESSAKSNKHNIEQRDSKTDSSFGGDNSDQSKVDENASTGLIYARVSSDKQRKGTADNENGEDKGLDEGSIEGQVEELVAIANRKNINLPYDPIVDEAKTGTDFDRDGIQEVFEKTKRKDIDYLLVEKVDRIGRAAAETLYFIHILQSECGVTLLTSSGSKDVSETAGLMQATVMSLTAQVQNDLRTKKASKERIRGFLKKKNWRCKSSVIPLGYNETDDGWLAVNPKEKTIVRDLFRKFRDCETYAETERFIDDKYGKKYLDGQKVKTILQNRVYIGEPRLSESLVADTKYENSMHEPELHLLKDEEDSKINVCEEVFEDAQTIIQNKEQQRSKDNTTGLIDFIEEFSLFSVIHGSETATLLHHCGNPLIKDGQVGLSGEYRVHRYLCRHCEESEDPSEYYRQWPREYELNMIKQIQQVIDGDEPDFLSTE